MTPFSTSRTSRTRRSSTKQRSGAVAAEFAIVAPLVFGLFFGCYEMARANLMQHAAESAAYEAARVGIIPGAAADEVSAAADFVLNSVGVSVFNVEVTPDVITRDTEKVTVEINVPFESNFSVGAFLMNGTSFRGTCTLNRELL
jgi:Flp pilus assembly protein TadG